MKESGLRDQKHGYHSALFKMGDKRGASPVSARMIMVLEISKYLIYPIVLLKFCTSPSLSLWGEYLCVTWMHAIELSWSSIYGLHERQFFYWFAWETILLLPYRPFEAIHPFTLIKPHKFAHTFWNYTNYWINFIKNIV